MSTFRFFSTPSVTNFVVEYKGHDEISWNRLIKLHLWPQHLFQINCEFLFDQPEMTRHEIQFDKMLIFEKRLSEDKVSEIILLPLFKHRYTGIDKQQEPIKHTFNYTYGRGPGVSKLKFIIIEPPSTIFAQTEIFTVTTPK